MSAKCARMERKLDFAGTVINAIARFLIIAINVRKPPNTASYYMLEVFAMLVE